MSDYNPGPATTGSVNQSAQLIGAQAANQTVYTYATLPSGGSLTPGSTLWTSDQGQVTWNGSGWITTGNRTLIQKIRAALAASSGNQNPAQRPPLLATPAWTASTTYAAGQVVTNGGAGNLYVCCVYGISAASGGPTGQAGAQQTDNTTAWQYFGQQLTYTSSVIAPVVSFVAYPTTGHQWFYANPLDTTAQAAPASTNFFTFEGGYWQATAANFGGLYNQNAVTNFNQLGGGSQVANVGGIQSSYWNCGHGGSVTFYTDASKIVLAVFANNGNGAYIEIDDQPLSDTYFYSASPPGIQLDWTGNGGKKTRKIRVYCDQLHGVAVADSISQVWAYSSPNAYNMVWNGDSTGQGSGGGPWGCGNNDAVRRFARMIGCESVCNNSIASSSFYTAANGTYNYLGSAALFRIMPNVPDVICVGGNFDDNVTSSANRRTACTAYLVAMRQQFPNALIILFGPWGGTFNGNAAITACEADMQYCVNAFNDASTFFIPLIARTNGLPWISGTGNISAPSGQGNADQYIYNDGVHPTCLAHKEYIPRVFAEAFKQLIASLSL
jgi:hypothetical protein